MTDSAARGLRARTIVPWSTRTWLRTAHVVTGVPIALLAFVVIVALIMASVLLVWTVVVPLATLTLLFWLVPRCTSLQRSRFVAFLDVDIPPVRTGPVSGNPVQRLVQRVRTRSNWRQLSYHLLSPVISVAGFFAVIGAWSGALIGVIAAIRGFTSSRGLIGLGGASAATVLLVVGPWLARGVTALDTIAAEALLGPSLSDQLALRVRTLQGSRADALDAADAERRRIERDLHDGIQQQLISLAMRLGVARAALPEPPGPGDTVIVKAHEEAKHILQDLRDFVRGLHPAVLNDQGLDAALSGLAARAPIPVRLVVEMPVRPSATIEAVAFFVVSEALTNVAKHAKASTAEVVVRRRDDVLSLVIRDDGGGGADPGRGTGLHGLAQRVGSVEGTLHVDSPAGGPTQITVDLPCE
jgi:signal transduction histidine kinase